MIIGYAYVCADILNVGHLNHLEACKNLCDKLVVGVLTNNAILEKKPIPIIPFNERLRLVQALGCVDIAVSQETYSPLFNATLMADVLFESTSHTQKAIKEAKKAMQSINKIVRIMPYYGGCSSSAIKKKVLKTWKEVKI